MRLAQKVEENIKTDSPVATPQISSSSYTSSPPIPVSASSSQSVSGGEGVGRGSAQARGGGARIAKGESRTEGSSCTVLGTRPPSCDGSSIMPPRVAGEGPKGATRSANSRGAGGGMSSMLPSGAGRHPEAESAGDVEIWGSRVSNGRRSQSARPRSTNNIRD